MSKRSKRKNRFSEKALLELYIDRIEAEDDARAADYAERRADAKKSTETIMSMATTILPQLFAYLTKPSSDVTPPPFAGAFTYARPVSRPNGAVNAVTESDLLDSFFTTLETDNEAMENLIGAAKKSGSAIAALAELHYRSQSRRAAAAHGGVNGAPQGRAEPTTSTTPTTDPH